jgi:hypothetical protein
MKYNTYKPRTNIAALLALLLAVTTIVANVGTAYAATLTSSSITLSDSRISQTGVTYDFAAGGVTTSGIQCIKLVFSDAATGGSVPAGMTTNGDTNDLTGNYIPTPANWARTNPSNGTIQFTGTSQTPASTSGRTLSLAGVTNGSSSAASYFLQFSTFNNTDCSSSHVDSVVVMYRFTDGQQVTATVDPTLTFTVAGVTGNGSLTVNTATITNGLATTSSTIPFGTLTSASNKIAAQDLTVTTNAGNGYTVFTRYTGVLTSGSFTISNLGTHTNAAPGAFSAAGTEGFGYTTEDSTLGTGTADRFTTTGGNKWAAFTTSNAEVAFNATGATSQTTRVGMQTGVASTTEPGSYATTVIYTATPIY